MWTNTSMVPTRTSLESTPKCGHYCRFQKIDTPAQYYCEDCLDKVTNGPLLLCGGTCLEFHNSYAESHIVKSLGDKSSKNWRPLRMMILTPSTLNLMRSLVEGLHEMHTLWPELIIHRDIKPENILLDCGSVGDLGQLKIGDLGLARDSQHSQVTSRPGVGTRGYTPPEALISKSSTSIANNHPNQNNNNNPNNPNNANTKYIEDKGIYKPVGDIFAAGCVMFYMMTMGEHPFGNTRDVCEQNIRKGVAVNLMLLLTGPYPNYEAHDLISHMITNEYKLRPSAQQVLHHPFFWSSATKIRFLREVHSYVKKEQLQMTFEDAVPQRDLLSLKLKEEKTKFEVFGRSWKESVHPNLLNCKFFFFFFFFFPFFFFFFLFFFFFFFFFFFHFIYLFTFLFCSFSNSTPKMGKESSL